MASKITDYQTHRFLTTARPYFKNGDYNKGVLSIVNNLNYMFYSGSSTTASSSKVSYDYTTNSSRLRELEGMLVRAVLRDVIEKAVRVTELSDLEFSFTSS